ncbi:MAG: hypothetical protein RQ833_09015 [Sphingomonadaceae bacterium]|nr:hypothetical protein [Sphingomonadaceae bacterium]
MPGARQRLALKPRQRLAPLKRRGEARGPARLAPDAALGAVVTPQQIVAAARDGHRARALGRSHEQIEDEAVGLVVAVHADAKHAVPRRDERHRPKVGPGEYQTRLAAPRAPCARIDQAIDIARRPLGLRWIEAVPQSPPAVEHRRKRAGGEQQQRHGLRARPGTPAGPHRCERNARRDGGDRVGRDGAAVLPQADRQRDRRQRSRQRHPVAARAGQAAPLPRARSDCEQQRAVEPDRVELALAPDAARRADLLHIIEPQPLQHRIDMHEG